MIPTGYTYDFVDGFRVFSAGVQLPALGWVQSPTTPEEIEEAVNWYWSYYSVEAEGVAALSVSVGCTADGVEAGTYGTKTISTDPDDGTYQRLGSTYYGPLSGSQPNYMGATEAVASPYQLDSSECFFTFRNVILPPNARLRKARLVFTANNTINTNLHSTTIVSLKIRGHLAANSTTNPTSIKPASPANWTRTETTIEWDSLGTWTPDQEYYSPDIACILQEIIDQAGTTSNPGWASGNALKLFVEDNGSDPQTLLGTYYKWAIRHGYTYNQATNKAVRLEYWYSNGFVETGSGGYLIGGSADVVSVWVETATGGYKLGGSGLDEVGSGGYEFGGQADTNQESEATGGYLIGGSADTALQIAVSGGYSIGGSADTVTDYTYEPTGGYKFTDGTYPNGKRFRVQIKVPANTLAYSINKFLLVANIEVDPNHVANNNDFIVEDNSGNRIYHDLRSYDNGFASIAVKATITANTDWVAYVYYGGN